MDKLKMQTLDGVQRNIDKIAVLFPNCITEKMATDGGIVHAIDFDKLRQELSSEIVEGREERYQFTWPDKKKAILLANSPINATLRPCREESVDFDNTQNLYIEGDNLDVLKCLKETYLGKVKMIYIDPPYNTGKDFVYNDDYMQNVKSYIDNSGQLDYVGNQLEPNLESNGRFHTDWLNMIYPRIKISKDLLADDGIMFVSIDEHEISNLKKILTEIFGDSCYIGTLIIQTATDNNPGQIKIEHEYMLCICKNRSTLRNWENNKEETKYIQTEYERLKKIYCDDCEKIQDGLRIYIKKNSKLLKGITHYDNVDSKGVFHDGDIANTAFGGYEYDLIHPVTKKVCKMPEKGFRFPWDTMKRMLEEDNILFGKDETTLPKPKNRLEDVKDKLRSVIYEDGRSSTKRFELLMARDIFQNPKSDTILARLIEFICKDGDIVLDFFSGSGTTAEAVFNLALKDIKLKFILVQLQENLDESIKVATSKAKKTMTNAINFLDSIKKPHLITEIGKERIRRAGKQALEEYKRKRINLITNSEYKTFDIGFRVLKLDSSNMEDIYYSPAEYNQQTLFAKTESVKSDRTSEDLLFQVMLELGATLDSKIEQIEIKGKTIYNVATNYLVACFDNEIDDSVVTAIAKMQPQYAVFRDSSMADDSTVTNFEQIFKTYSPNTVTKVL